LSQGIPAVGLAYSRKFDGVFRTFGVGELVVDLSLQTTEAALERVMEVFGKRERLQESLKITMPAIRQTALGLFGRIGQDRGWEVGATDRVQAQL
jgi:polysaccharide pyruvyl transferase WcaK-like protein